MTAFPKTREALDVLAADAPWVGGLDEEAVAELDLADKVIAAARALHEVVEMDESVGVCLTSRVESMALGAALIALGG